MDYVQPSIFSFTEQDPAVRIERCIRVAYKSENSICPGSAERIINFCIDNKHLSVLAHANAYVCTLDESIARFIQQRNPNYLSFRAIHSDMEKSRFYVYGNFRAWYETIINPYGKYTDLFKDEVDHKFYNACAHLGNTFNTTWPSIFKGNFGLVDSGPTENPFLEIGINQNWFTFLVTTDIGVGREWLRHTTLPPTQESTRYVNYKKKGLNICLPVPFEWSPQDSIREWVIQTCSDWMDLASEVGKMQEHYRSLIQPDGNITLEGQIELVRLAKIQTIWESQMASVENSYLKMLDYGAKPQEARLVLPLSTASTFAVSGDRAAWDHFILLRDAEDAQPQIRLIAEQVLSYFQKYDEEEHNATYLSDENEVNNAEHCFVKDMYRKISEE